MLINNVSFFAVLFNCSHPSSEALPVLLGGRGSPLIEGFVPSDSRGIIGFLVL